MLDAGIQLEPERARLVQALSQTAPDQWRPEDVQRLKEGMNPAVSGIPQKRIFGSDYPYRDAVQHLGLSEKDVQSILAQLLKREVVTFSAKGKEEILVQPRDNVTLPEG